jgi:hypothetical protein
MINFCTFSSALNLWGRIIVLCIYINICTFWVSQENPQLKTLHNNSFYSSILKNVKFDMVYINGVVMQSTMQISTYNDNFVMFCWCVAQIFFYTIQGLFMTGNKQLFSVFLFTTFYHNICWDLMFNDEWYSTQKRRYEVSSLHRQYVWYDT